MRMTITIDEGAAGPAMTPAAQGATSTVASTAPQQAGAVFAPEPALDGGTPPSWLSDSIAGAGGLSAPGSPESLSISEGSSPGGTDAGAAPAG